jgi:tRNA threonylcarbamoyladenosine biosynthesis protein TsaE
VSTLDVVRTAETVIAATDAEMRALGRRLAGVLRAGDLVILSGPLGAGKTTLTQGLGEGLGVRGPVTSPTFVLTRIHPAVTGAVDLVHVDAYRLTGPAELDDLDLDTALPESIIVVEWGEGIAEGLSADRLEISIDRAADDTRSVMITPIGERWADTPWADTAWIGGL